MSSPVIPGDLVARKYRVERVLGEGGIGVVVGARHLQLEQQVAIKFILPRAALDVRARARFVREARAAARLRSEHVSRVFDVAQLDDGSPYIVMEYLDGHDLAALLSAEGPLSIERAVDYVLQACEAISEAHAIGILHRDLKPENLFLARRADGSPCLKVLELGVPKSPWHEEDGAAHALPFVGSPSYMSPEQLTPEGTIDARTDVWSLGVVLYELVSGQLPFAGDGLSQLRVAVIEAPAPSLRDVRPDAPCELEAIILRCLEKDRAMRPASIGVLASQLARFRARHGRATARGDVPASGSGVPGDSEAGSVPRSRARGPIAAAAVVALVGILGVGIALWPHVPQPVAPDRSVLGSTSVRILEPLQARAAETPIPAATTVVTAADVSAPAPRRPPSEGFADRSRATSRPATTHPPEPIPPPAPAPAPRIKATQGMPDDRN